MREMKKKLEKKKSARIDSVKEALITCTGVDGAAPSSSGGGGLVFLVLAPDIRGFDDLVDDSAGGDRIGVL